MTDKQRKLFDELSTQADDMREKVCKMEDHLMEWRLEMSVGHIAGVEDILNRFAPVDNVLNTGEKELPSMDDLEAMEATLDLLDTDIVEFDWIYDGNK